MATLSELSEYIRSKGAGPFWVTIDIFSKDQASYETIKSSQKLTTGYVAKTYGVPAENVKAFYLDDLGVVKFSYPRPQIQGNKYENDMHSGQQYVLIADAEV